MHRGFRGMPYNIMGSWIVPIILIAIIGISIYMIVNNKKDNNNTRSNSALEILNERYAKGEINDEEYKKKKENLRNLKE
ncbi:MAG: SHOCT domain-containing protein [Tissierella sp.]|uniref:SHOCT domain-containing protein n=1 Tax=Tissierella sp. TaxID=41274 RepID=UPI003F9E9E2B